MADRYHDRAFPADGYGRGGDQRGAGRPEGDPLAELARLIGQTDASGNQGRTNPAPPPRMAPREPYPPAAPEEPAAPANPPSWMQRANPREIPRDAQRDLAQQAPGQEQDHPASAADHPFHRYGTQPGVDDHGYPQEGFAQPGPAYQEDHGYAEHEHEHEQEDDLDPSRYDDALYGPLDGGGQGAQGFGRQAAYPDDPYAYQDGYDEEGEEPPPEKRRGGLVTIVALLALAVVGTGAAFAYRTYFSTARSGEPPIIRADNTPTKIIPAPPDGSTKVPDRLVSGDGSEKLVPREEAPVDVDANANANSGGPRVVFPQLNTNNNPPPPSSLAQNGIPAAPSGGSPSNGTMANGEPRKIRTFSVHGDQADASAAPAAPQAAPAPVASKPGKAAKTARNNAPPPDAANANASANQPMSLSPQQDQAPAADSNTRALRTAATNPTQDAAPADSAVVGYLVQVSSQRSENDAQASFKALQAKFPNVLGSQTPVVKRVDLGEKGIYYRALVGPFGSQAEAGQFCGSLKNAGGQCIVQKN